MKNFFIKFTAVFTAVASVICTFIFIKNGSSKNINTHVGNYVNPDSWVAVDSLGRTLPTYEDVGEKNNKKFVGMFYWTWHYNFAKDFPARNVQKIIQQHPEAINDFNNPVWENTSSGTPYFWNEPVFGYYSNLDEYVVRKHAEMIADAGVDVIIFDCTNGTFLWDEAYETLFKVFNEAITEGVNVPQISFILPFFSPEDTRTSLNNLYDRIYSKNRYKNLWFMWDGKPLLMANPDCLDRKNEKDGKIYDFFTYRVNEATYFKNDTWKKENTWGWCSVYPQTKFGKNIFGRPEEMCVSVAQNASKNELVAMNDPAVTVRGKNYTVGNYSYSFMKNGKKFTVNKNTENATLYGLNFQQQWDYAIRKNPDFIFVTGWNEWIAGRHSEWQGTENAFPDEYCDEFSRDIEPTKGSLKDNYYYQLVANIRRFKGVDKPVSPKNYSTVDIGNFDLSQWNNSSLYNHYTGSTKNRDADGWVGLHYTNSTLRNDFKSVRVSSDKDNIYFRIETVSDITSYQSKAWMRILIDTDFSGNSQNWEGFEYIVNRDNATEDKVNIESSTGGWNFKNIGSASYKIKGNIMQIALPKSSVGLENKTEFNFKLSDNMQLDGDISDFYQNGDVAPGGRFCFAYKEEK